MALAAVNQDGYALYNTTENLKNDKEVVLAAVNQNGSALCHASDILQNDLELLNLLHDFHNLPENKIKDKNLNYQKWFEKRMNIRDILIEQNLMQEYIPNNEKLFKSRSLKF